MSFMARVNEKVKQIPTTTTPKKDINLPETTDNQVGIAAIVQYLDNKTEDEIQTTFSDLDFQTDISPALRKYKELGFNKQQLTFIYKQQPLGLALSKSGERNDIVKYTTFLQQKYNLNTKELRNAVLRAPTLLSASNEVLQNRIDYLKKRLEISDVSYICNF